MQEAATTTRARRVRGLAALALTAALGLALAACGPTPSNTNAEKIDLVVGSLVPKSGELAGFGEAGGKAAELAVKEIESAIEDDGADHTIELVAEDDGGGGDPAAAVRGAKQLAGSDADCITGAWGSGDTLSVAVEVAIPGEIPLVSPASTSDELTALTDGDLVSRTVPPDRYQGQALANAIEEDLGEADGASVNVAAREDADGTSLAESFTAAWEDNGGEVAETIAYEPGAGDYAAEAEQIVAGKPGAIVIADDPESFTTLAGALAATPAWDPRVAWGSDGLAAAEVAKAAGDAVEGMRVIAPGVPKQADLTKAFAKLLGEEGEVPPFAAQQFDATILCYLGAVQAGSTDGTEIARAILDVSGPAGDDYTYEELPGAIQALEDGEDIDYAGVSGDIDMDKAGDPTTGYYDISRFKGGALERIDQVPASGDGG